MSTKIKNTFKKASSFFQAKKFFSKKFLMVSFAMAVVIAGTSIPAHCAQADILGNFLKIDFSTMIMDAIAGIFTSDGLIMNFIYGLGVAILSVLLNLVSYYVYLGAWFVDAMLQESIYRDVLGSSAITTGWTTIRDMCNTFFIFFLLLIAFATILRIQHFGSTKKLLINFIVSIFLINFSMVIAKIIIDVGQVFMYEIVSWMGTFQGSGISLTSIVDKLKDEVNIGQYGFAQFVKAGFALVYAFMLAIAYFMLAGFLLIRLIMFAVLIVLSPFAFLSLILPSMKRHTSKWFTELVNQSLLGPIFLFFIYLSATMANELVGNDYMTGVASLGKDLSAIEEIVSVIIPNVIALAMLYMVIPVSKELSSKGSSVLIGGAGAFGGFGKVMMGTYGAIKLSGGSVRKVGGGTTERIHAGLKEHSSWYKGKSEKVSGRLKTLPIAGNVFVKRESEKVEKRKTDIAKHEKIMDNLTAKDKKTYIDNKTDPKAKADATQAMLNLLAKDSGKGTTDKRIEKMGYKDKESFKKVLGTARAYGHDTEKFDKYRPDLIEGKTTEETKKDKENRVEKIVHDGEERNIKASALNDPIIKAKVLGLIGDRKYKDLVSNKSQEEKDTIIEHDREMLSKKHDSYCSVIGKKEDVSKLREEIFELSGSNNKLDALGKVEIKDGKVEFSGELDPEFAGTAVSNMTSEELVEQNPEFLKKVSYMSDPTQINRVSRSRYATKEKTSAIEESMVNRIDKISAKKSISEDERDERDKLYDSLHFLNSKITRPTKKGPDKGGGGSGGSGGGTGSSGYGFASSKSQQSVPKNESSVNSNKETIKKIEGLAKEEGFEGINVSKEKKGVSVSFAASKGEGISVGENQGKVNLNPEIIKNTKELFEADEEFGKKGMASIMKHEKQHKRGPASKVAEKEMNELREYSEREGVSDEDIENKEVELHNKYYAGGETHGRGAEMQTELQRVNEGFKDPDKFIEDEARTHVTADAIHEGMSNLGKMKYDSENPGLNRTHSAFIKQDVADKITARMEKMRQDLVKKHNEKKGMSDSDDGAGDEKGIQSSSKGDDREPVKKGKMKRAADIAMGKNPAANIAVDEAALKALEVGGLVHKGVAVAGIPLKPIIKEDIEINEEKSDGADISNKEATIRRAKALKKGLTPAVLEHSDEYVGKAGDGAGGALKEFGKSKGGKIGAAATVAGKVLGNKGVQKAASMGVKKLADQDGKQTAGSLRDTKNMIKGKDPVAADKAAMKVLEVGSEVDKRIAKIEPIARPMLEKQLEIDERRQGGEKISQWQEDKEKFGALVGALKQNMPKNPENDGKYIGGVGEVLSEAGERSGGKAGSVLKTAGGVLQNENMQKRISKGVRSKLNKESDGESEGKDSQKTFKKTGKTDVASKRKQSSDNAIKKSGSEFGEEVSQQIREAFGEINSNITQTITQNIELGSSPQEAIDIDFEKMDTAKIAELIKEGINVDDVKESLDDVKKNIDEFKENNEGANTTVVDAGITATQAMIDRTLTIKDRKDRDIKLIAAMQMLTGIKLKLNNRADKSSPKEK